MDLKFLYIIYGVQSLSYMRLFLLGVPSVISLYGSDLLFQPGLVHQVQVSLVGIRWFA